MVQKLNSVVGNGGGPSDGPLIDYRHLAANKFGREHRQAIVLTIHVTMYDPDVLALDISSFSASQRGRPTGSRKAMVGTL